MNVVVNGTATELRDGATIADVLAHVDAPDRGVAVAVDAEVIPKSAWDGTSLHEGARVEVVVAVQGG